MCHLLEGGHYSGLGVNRAARVALICDSALIRGYTVFACFLHSAAKYRNINIKKSTEQFLTISYSSSNEEKNVRPRKTVLGQNYL